MILMPILVLALYWNSLDVPFHYDDHQNIKINTNIHLTELSFDQLKHCWNSTNRPVAMVSFALNYYFGGLNVTGFHAVNILIHIIAAIFLYLFILNTLKLPTIREKNFTHAQYIAILSTLLWVTSPLHTQAVTYIVQRMTSMSAMFFIMAMYFYLKARTSAGKKAKAVCFSLSLVSGLLAMGSKENAYMLPCVFFIYDFFLIQGLTRENTLRFVKWTCMFLPFGIFFAFKVYTGFDQYGEYFFTLKERLLTEPRIIFLYISLLIFPDSNRLTLFHDIPLSHSLTDPFTTGLSILAVALLVVGSLIFSRRWPLICFCVLFFFINHVIESSFLPLHLMFEHRVYLPSMLFFLPVSIWFFQAIRALANRKNAVYMLSTLMAMVILGQCYDTVGRNNTWESEYTLWNDIINKAPNLSDGHAYMGVLLRKQGLYKQAEKALNKSIELDAFTNKGSKKGATFTLIKNHYVLGQYDQALVLGQKMVKMTNSDPLIYYYMGLIHQKTGNYEIAVDQFNKALAGDENFIMALNSLGDLFLEIKEPAKALKVFEKVKRIAPDDMESWVHGAIALARTGDLEGAIALLQPVWKGFNGNNYWSVKAVLALLEYQYRTGDRAGMEKNKTIFENALGHKRMNATHDFLTQNKEGIARHIDSAIVLDVLDGKQ